MKAYKGFNTDMTCLGFKYKEGETYTTSKAKLCERGSHACYAVQMRGMAWEMANILEFYGKRWRT